jgi:hypothetical protein
MIKTYRKGRTTFYKAPGISISVDDAARDDLYAIASFLTSINIPDEGGQVSKRGGRRGAAPGAPATEKPPRAPKAEGDSINMFEEVAALIEAGVNTEDGMVKALSDKLIAAGKKSPARAVSTTLRHARVKGNVKESADGTFTLVKAA